MRSYWMSLTFIAVLLLGYTAIVLSSHVQNMQPKMETPHASTDLQPREPAAQAAAVDSRSNVN